MLDVAGLDVKMGSQSSRILAGISRRCYVTSVYIPCSGCIRSRPEKGGRSIGNQAMLLRWFKGCTKDKKL